MQSQEQQNDLCSFPRQTIQYHSTPSLRPVEAEAEWFYEDLQELLELTPKQDVFFIIGDWNAKVGVTVGLTVGVTNLALEYRMKQCKGS